LKKNREKDRKKETIKEVFYPKIKIYDLRGRVIGILGLGESINYQKLLSKKKNGVLKRDNKKS
jgi:hypothetical protein